MTTTKPTAVKAPEPAKEFDLRDAQAELAQLKKRARQLEAEAVEHQRLMLRRVGTALYQATDVTDFVAAARAFNSED